MALLSELVRVVAQVEGLEEVSVGIFARQAREAGLIKQGGRGRSAAKMSLRDAVNLLIAVNGCSLAKDVPRLVPEIRSMVLKYECENIAEKLDIRGLNFGEALEKFIEWMADVDMRISFPGQTFVTFSRPILRADITCDPVLEGLDNWPKLEYEPNYMHRKFTGIVPVREGPYPDRTEEITITHGTLIKIAKLILK
jgi:hypothetical protein